MSNRGLIFPVFLACAVVLIGSTAQASLSVSVSFNDSGANSAYYQRIENAMTAAANAWGKYIETMPGQTLSIQLNFTNEATASAGSNRYVYASTEGGVLTYMAGSISKLVYGGSSGVGAGMADAVFNIGADWLKNVVWWNPDPGSTTPPPWGQVDSHYLFMHELGHILGFSSFRDANGNLPTSGGIQQQSTYDAQTVWDNGNLFFTGDAAMTAYGGKPLALTKRNFSHYGNGEGPGTDLVDDVMNGVVSKYQNYQLSGMDVGLLSDLGYKLTDAGRDLVYGQPPPPAVPEPASIIALALGVCGVGVGARRAGVRRRAA